MNALATVILLVGASGYCLAIYLLFAFRFWMARRGEGWPRILLNTLLALVTLLTVLYFDSLLRQVGLNEDRRVRLVLSFSEGIALMIAPWVLVVAIWRWWPKAGRRYIWRRRK